jgi:hypothetical protein
MLNPQFQLGLEGMPESQHDGTPKAHRSGSLIIFGVAHKKSPSRPDVEGKLSYQNGVLSQGLDQLSQ